METEGARDEPVVDSNDVRRDRSKPVARKIVGLIVAVVLVMVAQRDLWRRPAELVRDKVGVWKAVAGVGPGALVYLVFGRRRAAPSLNNV